MTTLLSLGTISSIFQSIIAVETIRDDIDLSAIFRIDSGNG